MRPKDSHRAEELRAALAHYEATVRVLPGLHPPQRLEVLIEQLLDSERRVLYVERLRQLNLSHTRAEPHSPHFDPLKAAALHANSGNPEEAAWLVFLSIYFGKHRKGAWRYVREVYAGPAGAGPWDWQAASANPAALRAWLEQNAARIRAGGPGGFGNHRKYESLALAGAAIESYIRWVGARGGHVPMVQHALAQSGGDPYKAFQTLYDDLHQSGARFGRLARFDYLAMMDKLGLGAIRAGSPYLSWSTGPLKGARLLFGGHFQPKVLDTWLSDLGFHLNTGMQVLEDALCNWQKSPHVFVRFRA
jgi:hypothetical protein